MIFRWYDSFIAIFCISLISFSFVSKFREEKIPEYGNCLPFRNLQFHSDFDIFFENQSVKLINYTSEEELYKSTPLYDSLKVFFSPGAKNYCLYDQTSSIYKCFINAHQKQKHIKFSYLTSLLIKTVEHPLQISDDLDGVEQCAAFEQMSDILNCNRTNDYSNHFDIYNSIRSVYMTHYKPKLSLDLEEKAAVLIPTLLPSIIIILRLFVKGNKIEN